VEPYKHLIVSVIIGFAGFYLFEDIFILMFTVLFGSFVDFDHYFEYIHTTGLNQALNIREFYHSKHFIQSNRMILIFHSWEYVFILFLITATLNYDILFLFITLGYTSHLLLDQIGNFDLKWSFYFLSIRAYYRFNRNKLVRQKYLHVTGDDRKGI
jgi:membrane-bound metal-dependent hydrolase YbcI (DUF457 family)